MRYGANQYGCTASWHGSTKWQVGRMFSFLWKNYRPSKIERAPYPSHHLRWKMSIIDRTCFFKKLSVTLTSCELYALLQMQQVMCSCEYVYIQLHSLKTSQMNASPSIGSTCFLFLFQLFCVGTEFCFGNKDSIFFQKSRIIFANLASP